ncbi:helix-turn-helix domain-containing protein [Nocardioides limicola]|uniref:helix-turn-helix domain-containing protein n=1 Tax=Nocardioides limicola TaxID=2803368 RepID=UPI00193C5921|nr:XRE family transcriptional regulator [Nocardioides sp. DJM-14]
MSGNDVVARNVRRFRIERNLSLGEVARRSGLAKQTVSKVELGTGNPTVETLMALSEALDVPVQRLLTEWGTPVFVQRAGEAEWENADGGDIRALDQIYGSGYVITRLVRLEAGADSGALDAQPQGTLYHAYVISGAVRIGPLADPVEVEAGDFVRFPADVPHLQVCLAGPAALHIVVTMPQVRQIAPQVLNT